MPVCTPNQRTLVAAFKPKQKKTQRLSTPKLTKKHVKHAQKETQSLVSPIPWKPTNPTRRTCSPPNLYVLELRNRQQTLWRGCSSAGLSLFFGAATGAAARISQICHRCPEEIASRWMISQCTFAFVFFFQLFQDGRDKCRIQFNY